MADEKTVTEREAVERERKAVDVMVNSLMGAFDLGAAGREKFNFVVRSVRDRVLSRYPLPVQKRPLRVTLSHGLTVWRGMNGWYVRYPDGLERGGITSTPNVITGDDMRLLARCLDGEMEDVPEGEE